jgi:uncharacterized membrane protein YdjX (TVP38/TMEM64 family)
MSHLHPVSTSHTPASGAAASRRKEKKRRSRGPRWKLWISLALLFAAAGAAFVYFTDFEWRWGDLAVAMQRLNPYLLVFLMAVLPLIGFSVGVVYLVAGVTFGPVLGGVIVLGATAIHLVASHAIARGMLRKHLVRFLENRGYHLPDIPPGENIAIAAMGALMPGVPYFARNYLLALAGVPLRVYFWVCLPIYVARSYIVILLGHAGSDLSTTRVVVFACVYVIKLSVCAYVIARLRRRYRQTHPKPAAKKA